MLQAGGQWRTVARRAAYVLLQQGALSFSSSLPSTVPVLHRSQCCAVCRCAVQSKSTSSATCVDNGGEGADCSQRGGLLAKVSAAPLCHIPAQKNLLYLLEQAFSAPQLPPGHRFPMVGAAAAPTPRNELEDYAPGLSHASLRRVCVLRAGVGRVPAHLCHADPRWDAP